MPQPLSEPIIIATQPDQRALVLRLLHFDTARIERFLAAAAAGQVNLGGLYHASRSATLVGAAWGQMLPGKAAFCWPASILPGEPESTAHKLQEAVDRHLDREGILTTQSLLSPQEIAAAVRLNRAGYRHLADLDYLACQLPSSPITSSPITSSPITSSPITSSPITSSPITSSPITSSPITWPPSELVFVPSGRSPQMRHLVERTYVNSLDCARLDESRSCDEILHGYVHTGVFRPQWWIVAQHHGTDVGCALMADHPDQDFCELMYVGIVPEQRGRGWGAELVQYMCSLATSAHRQQLILAVDDANWPAHHMYSGLGLGFSRWDRRSVYVRTARSHGPRAPSGEL